jgi:selenide, water dikinase
VHADEVAKASGLSIQINDRMLKLLPGALEYSRAALSSTSLNNNRESYGPHVVIDNAVIDEMQNILFDPQTSGGLLIFCQRQDADALLKDLVAAGLSAFESGFTSKLAGPLLTVT